MLYKEYFKNKKLSQEILNKKINWFYDIKSILYQENNNFKKETLKNAKYANETPSRRTRDSKTPCYMYMYVPFRPRPG